MPEGDVVARVARRLTAALADGPLTRADLRWPTLAGISLVGRRSAGTASYGKHLLTRFDDGSTLHTHLRMEGAWRIQPADHVQRRSRADLRALLATDTWACLGLRLGMMDLVRTRDEHLVLAGLGTNLMAPDAESHAPEAARRLLSDPHRSIGAALLDQRVAAGIGTIWMAETLFRHRTSPLRPAGDTDGEALFTTAIRLMRASADAPAAPGTPGSVSLAVHGRAGQDCPRCGHHIAVVQVGTAPFQRPAFFCPGCQPR